MRKRVNRTQITKSQALWRSVLDYGLITIGCAVAALGFDAFMRPLSIASGGVVGLSVVVATVTGIEPAYTQWALNIPLLAVGFLFIGRGFGVRTVLGATLLPFFILIFKQVPGPTSNTLLSAGYAGVAIGFGIGLVFRGKGSVGGFSVLARVISGPTGIAPSQILMAFDGMVVIAAGILMGLEQAMYALVVVVVMGKTMDVVLTGLGLSKSAIVVSARHEEIGKAILQVLDRGYTRLEASGGYTGENKPALLCVMDPAEVGRFKSIVLSIDPSAFVVIGEAHEVHGLGFAKRI